MRLNGLVLEVLVKEKKGPADPWRKWLEQTLFLPATSRYKPNSSPQLRPGPCGTGTGNTSQRVKKKRKKRNKRRGGWRET